MSSSDTDSTSQGTSTRPYLIRALHDWCTDNGFTPYLAVYVDRSVQVPMEYVKNNEIVLNVSFEATSQLQLGNEFIEFKARFGGTAREIIVPVDHVIAIYARENGQGMAFPVPNSLASDLDAPEDDVQGQEPAFASREGEASDRSPLRLAAAKPEDAAAGSGDPEGGQEPPPAGGGRPTLRRIK
ncbi:ClpXP protease specificity-enhancing factor [Aquabacterium fontiphilum]|jgi:stringent starvation protein B|uniref:ClpXP protease specificity-enhancing factor n=1 Tax=Aquabacterium fontiphilum TaxID=450365 RepID=UPI001378250F|nr:ClpXP protease specificity-enhancing factor [Aquabacterium fontiphilum]NBD20138.1 ClpXP protease specificity-enhancing factor [Aquabacterium fontiphilum]